MIRFKLIPGILVCCIATFALLQIGGCANIVPPSGGPRDSIPPYAVYAKPKDSSLNIAPREILISFNEYITTNALQEQLIVSPNIKNNPLIDQRLNMLRIRLSDSLNTNTTYSLQFGNAVRDVNEGNIAKDFTYVFSTGDYIDTGRLNGKVLLAENGLVDSTLVAVLHPAENDSAIFKTNLFIIRVSMAKANLNLNFYQLKILTSTFFQMTIPRNMMIRLSYLPF